MVKKKFKVKYDIEMKLKLLHGYITGMVSRCAYSDLKNKFYRKRFWELHNEISNEIEKEVREW